MWCYVRCQVSNTLDKVQMKTEDYFAGIRRTVFSFDEVSACAHLFLPRDILLSCRGERMCFGPWAETKIYFEGTLGKIGSDKISLEETFKFPVYTVVAAVS